MIKNNKESLRMVSTALKKHLSNDEANDVLLKLASGSFEKQEEHDDILNQLVEMANGMTEDAAIKFYSLLGKLGLHQTADKSYYSDPSKDPNHPDYVAPVAIPDVNHETDKLWGNLQNVPSLDKNKIETHHDSEHLVGSHERHLLHDPNDHSNHNENLAEKEIMELIKIANVADDYGMYEEADELTALIPKIRTAQYEGFQSYTIQNSRAFENAVRQKLETKTPNEAWWETLEEYQDSLLGDQDEFLSKYASVQASKDSAILESAISNLLLEEITAKMTSGREPGVAVMEVVEDIKSGRYARNNISKANLIIKSIKKNEQAERELVEAGVMDWAAKKAGDWWRGGFPSAGEFKQKFQGLETEITKLITEMSRRSALPAPQNQIPLSMVNYMLAKYLIPIGQFSQLIEKFLPGHVSPVPQLKSIANKNGAIEPNELTAYINNIDAIVDISNDEESLKTIDQARAEAIKQGNDPRSPRNTPGNPAQQGQGANTANPGQPGQNTNVPGGANNPGQPPQTNQTPALGQHATSLIQRMKLNTKSGTPLNPSQILVKKQKILSTITDPGIKNFVAEFFTHNGI